MAESNRQRKFASLIQQELAEVFQRETTHLLGNAFITITRVHVSPDLGVARVHLSFMLAKDPQGLLDTIEENKKDIRHKLGQRIRKEVRIIPELAFFLDEGAEYAQKIDSLLDSLEIPEEDPDDELEADD
ncbi:MAG TPA: 30S ribosome-binding factor RbfA [Cytophagales bacterium]|nr:30S ribosome-binding factor RbfA [Cytophagales bacterium]HAA21248.1 30S ribosome-binding factor RbfA [Cytophagales bacterium]HAP62436.1 30S ribosome-binding factor RbfA [Cytophagales bacterium]